jgi:hypothetical protein
LELIKNMASAERQSSDRDKSIRKGIGTAAEYGGAIFGLVELLGLEFGAAFVGGLIWLTGRWLRYSE